MREKIVWHSIKLHEVIVDKVNCRRLGKLTEEAQPVVDFLLKGKTINTTEAYSYLTVKVSFPEEPKPFYLELTVRGRFVTDKPGTRAKLKDFAENKTIVALFPWVREAVADFTRQMGFPPLYLPLINVEKTVQAGEESDQEEKE